MTAHDSLRCALIGALALCCETSSAQAPAPGGSFSVTSIYQADADLEGHGEAGYSGLLASAGHVWSVSPDSTVGLTARFDFEDWNFDRLRAFGGAAPWAQLLRAGVSGHYATTVGDWRLSVAPTVEYSGESGADFSDALVYGATMSAATRLSPSLTLGLGAGVFQQIEKNRIFPYLIVDWRITDRLRLSNPFVAGPAGPAGLELSYGDESGWEFGVGASKRVYRYRLEHNGPFSDGVGERKFVPLFMRVGRKLAPTLSLDVYLGVSAGSRLRVEDASGNRLYDEKLDSTPLLGLSLSGRF